MNSVLSVLVFLAVQVHSAKIAVLVFPSGGSHFFMMEAVGQQLEARGLQVRSY